MKVRIKRRPSGLYNGAAWPAAGEVTDLPEALAASLLSDDTVELVELEEESISEPELVPDPNPGGSTEDGAGDDAPPPADGAQSDAQETGDTETATQPDEAAETATAPAGDVETATPPTGDTETATTRRRTRKA